MFLIQISILFVRIKISPLGLCYRVHLQRIFEKNGSSLLFFKSYKMFELGAENQFNMLYHVMFFPLTHHQF